MKNIDELGNEYWESRELMTAFGYSRWRNFNKIITKTKISM